MTVVLPCLNEAENLRDVVGSVTEAAERCAYRHEIVIVDDGSTDDTIAIAGQLASRDRRVQLVVHAGNRGYGEAVRSGIAAAKADWVLMIDADLQLDACELEDFLGPAQSADVVIGRRIMLRGPIGQRLSGAVWRGVLHRALRLPYGDIDCGYRLARRALLQALDLRAVGALAGAELLVKSQAAGARIAEVPVHHRTRVAGHHDGTGTRWSAGTAREIVHLRRWNTAHGGRRAVPRVGV
ncbi:glycosyltransferase family 2 protein [Solirubrobacter soli]|uniref:glycosyltransferase family 2 protein n=1 Tax=Solirubrobacter soli TaxID=363832 RepID=UPI0003F7B2ED|nr:glycosyltransferase family 2 protein [Solirubrobacter soli]